MPEHRIFSMAFSAVYPLYVQKAERKKRTKAEVDQIIGWLTGYTPAGLQKQLKAECDIKTFFTQAPAFHPNAALITGVVCGVRVEEVQVAVEKPRVPRTGCLRPGCETPRAPRCR